MQALLDATDATLVALLQEDASLPLAELARRVHLSPTPTWKRIQRLKADGVLTRQVFLADPHSLGMTTGVFVAVRTNQHSEAWLAKFARAVRSVPEIVEVYRMSGDTDYLLRVVVPDIAGYDAVYRRLIGEIELFDVSSSFVMEELKRTTAIPVANARPATTRPARRARPRHAMGSRRGD